jgi:DNA-binding MarR family transcriptional regulator
MDRVSSVVDQWGTERPELDASPLLVVERIDRIASRLAPELARVCARHGLGRGEFDVLSALRRHGAPYALSPGELAAHTMVTSGAATKRVDRLVGKGLVQRRGTPSDGRARTVSLTPRGRRLVDAVVDEQVALGAGVLAGLDPDERSALGDLLGRLAAALGT